MEDCAEHPLCISNAVYQAHRAMVPSNGERGCESPPDHSNIIRLPPPVRPTGVCRQFKDKFLGRPLACGNACVKLFHSRAEVLKKGIVLSHDLLEFSEDFKGQGVAATGVAQGVQQHILTLFIGILHEVQLDAHVPLSSRKNRAHTMVRMPVNDIGRRSRAQVA